MTPQPDALPACPPDPALVRGQRFYRALAASMTHVGTDHYGCGHCPRCADFCDGFVAGCESESAQSDIAHALAASRAEVERERASKDGAYDERNRLVAVLAALYPSSLERHPDEDTTWENDWRWIVFVDLPTGQATWHIHDSHLPLFDHVPRFAGRKWDGHNTEAKYKRIEAMAALAAQGGDRGAV